MSETMLKIFTHAHGDTWAILFLLFLASVIFRRQKVTQMIQRVFYLIMIASGIGLLVEYGFPTLYIVKAIIAIVMIGCMEMVLVRINRKQPFMPMLIGSIVLAVVVVLIGRGVISF
ncbi:YisL family protein [Paenibacillus sp. N1-5-1-14]|uniref:YisL family protein n=1 Tax=Paenibacillus radicibacter TaxID=2972488 RepID=UPI002158F350|nr:YisL family protein [Paenibacillus radicibacter]MCR8645652.1 YisL family protein [Paenibacillus radicibacter]